MSHYNFEKYYYTLKFNKSRCCNFAELTTSLNTYFVVFSLQLLAQVDELYCLCLVHLDLDQLII